MHGIDFGEALRERVERLNEDMDSELEPTKMVNDFTGKPLFSGNMPLSKALHLKRLLFNRIYVRALEPFLNIYYPLMVQRKTEVLRKTETIPEVKAAYELWNDEQIFQGGLLFIARNADESHSLTKVSTNVYCAEDESEPASRFRRRIREEVIPTFQAVKLWKCIHFQKTNSWNISAGDALLKFDELVFCPWGVRHHEFFHELIPKLKK
ncbi:hypothetical protein [Bradyrhizobium japonicum]|uniref:hypothetical protein n=1 Tax=Bradyrhizobium japonicum TaxID=375 RepID=UPI003396FE1C